MEQSQRSLTFSGVDALNSPGRPCTRARRVPTAQSCAVATILGAEGTEGIPSPCRIVGISWSGMSIAIDRPGERGAQVCVQWDEGFFVGNNSSTVAKGEEYLLRLRLIACSYRRLPPMLLFLVSLPERAVIEGQAKLVRAIQTVACAALGARLRPVVKPGSMDGSGGVRFPA